MGIPNEVIIASSASHENMVKFASRRDDNYRVLLRILTQCLMAVETEYKSKDRFAPAKVDVHLSWPILMEQTQEPLQSIESRILDTTQDGKFNAIVIERW